MIFSLYQADIGEDTILTTAAETYIFYNTGYFIKNKIKEAICKMTALDKTALVLIIIGAINWLLVGLAQVDVVALLFGGAETMLSRIIYTIIGLAGLWAITMLVRPEIEAK